MMTSDRVRLTASEMKELEGLTFRNANGLLNNDMDGQRRLDELQNKDRVRGTDAA